MSLPPAGRSQEDLMIGYFAKGAQACRAMNELIDEGFRASEIGAAFRTPRAVAPARRPAAGERQVYPGAETPSTLRHALSETAPETLPHELPGALPAASEQDDRWLEHLNRAWGSSAAETARNRNAAAASTRKFGAGEGALGLMPELRYSESAFETTFTGIGLTPDHARSLSSELGRGGAIVTVDAGSRASLAEAILARNHGRVRFESGAGTTTLRSADRDSPVQMYGSMCDYYRDDEDLRRKAS